MLCSPRTNPYICITVNKRRGTTLGIHTTISHLYAYAKNYYDCLSAGTFIFMGAVGRDPLFERRVAILTDEQRAVVRCRSPGIGATRPGPTRRIAGPVLGHQRRESAVGGGRKLGF